MLLELTNSIRNFEDQTDLFFNFPFIDFCGCVGFNNDNSKCILCLAGMHRLQGDCK